MIALHTFIKRNHVIREGVTAVVLALREASSNASPELLSSLPKNQFAELMKTVNYCASNDRIHCKGDETEFIKAMKDINC